MYDMVLIERPAGDGLLPEEIIRMISIFPENTELLPVEFDSKYGDSSAMGFITTKAEEKLYADNDPVDVEDTIGKILSDMTLERDDDTYQYFGITFYMSRNVWGILE